MDILEKIINLYNEIDTFYKNIIVLEYENKFDDNKYLLCMKLLKQKISLEKELFSEFLVSDREGYEWIVKLLEENMLELEDYVVSRLYDYMSIQISNNPKSEVDTLEEQMQIESMNRLDKLYREFSKNLYLIYLSFMGDYINSVAFSSVKKSLLSFKYFGSLTNHDMEEVLIYYNFNVGKSNYIDLNFMATGLRIDEKLAKEVSYMVYSDAVRSSVIDLLSFNDSEYDDIYKKTNCISSGCMFRAGLLLLSDNIDEYRKTLNEVYKIIDEMGNFYNGLSIDIVKSIIGCVGEDKKRIKKLSVISMS